MALGVPAASKAKEIKIGWSGPLSGDGAAWGQMEQWGVQAAEKEINDAGGVLGRPIKVIFYDDRADKLEVVNSVKRLITRDKVVAVLTHAYSSCCLAVAPLAEQYKVPFVSAMATHPTVTEPTPGSGKPRPNFFRVVLTAVAEGGSLATYVRERGFGKAAVIYDISQDYSLGIRDSFTKKFNSLGGKIVVEESIKGGEEEFRAVLTRIKAANPDVIIFTVYYKEAALLMKQARALGLDQQFAGGNGLESEVLTQLAGPAAEGAYVTTHFSPEDPRPIVQEFRDRFKAEHKIDPDSNAGKAHDALYLVADAIRRAKSDDSKAIRDAIEKTTKLDGVAGTITMNLKTHNPSGSDMPMVILQVKDGALHYVKSVSGE
jgi:branched-chain amino acid transport system substrate-binding protein